MKVIISCSHLFCIDKARACAELTAAAKENYNYTLLDCNIECCIGNNCNNQSVYPPSPGNKPRAQSFGVFWNTNKPLNRHCSCATYSVFGTNTTAVSSFCVASSERRKSSGKIFGSKGTDHPLGWRWLWDCACGNLDT